MSATPLTDARRDDVRINCDDSCCEVYVEHNGAPCEVVTIDFARSLEVANQQAMAEIVRLQILNRRALAIITDAIMHGMPITPEIADVRNQIVQIPSA